MTDQLVAVAPDPTVCQVAITLLSRASRAQLTAHGKPSDDQALAIACRCIDAGVDCDERHVFLALVLLRSRATIQWIQAYA